MQNEPEKMIEIEEDFGVDNWEGLSAAYEALDKFYEDLENEDEEGEN